MGWEEGGGGVPPALEITNHPPTQKYLRLAHLVESDLSIYSRGG